MIIDCHTHWGMVWEERDRGDPRRWLAVLDRHGIDRALVFGHANLHRLDWCRQDNDLLRRVCDTSRGRMLPIGTVWLQMGAEALDEARRCVEQLGMKGLKFHPWLQGASVVSPVMDDLCRLAAEYRLPLFFHDGTPCYSLSEQIAGLALRFASTEIVLGHSGLLWNWRSALFHADIPNLWFCLCGPTLRTMEIMARSVPATRLLWGSDFGFGFADTIEYRLELARRACIPDPIREQMLGANAQRLLEHR
jgi:predicted TIM-barrel fold metal-dependent hydrolase